jgi:hypothetical protein
MQRVYTTPLTSHLRLDRVALGAGFEDQLKEGLCHRIKGTGDAESGGSSAPEADERTASQREPMGFPPGTVLVLASCGLIQDI